MRFTVARVPSIAGPLMAIAAAGLLCLLFAGIPVAWASSSCPNEGFRTGPGANLPDCRAYEMVSPPDKNGGEVDGGPIFEGNPPAPQQAASDGEAVTYGSQTTFTEANPLSGMLTTQYISRRGPNGWSTQAIDPEQNQPGGGFNREQGAVDFSLFQGFSEDLSHSFLLAYEPSPVADAPAKFYNPYVRDDLTGSYQLLSKETPPVQRPGIADNKEGLKIEYAGMSADGKHVIFAANDKLTPGALPGVNNLYEWNDGSLELVNVLPGGVATSQAEFGREETDQGGLEEGYDHVISADGSRVIWSAGSFVSTADPTQIYMHELAATGVRTVHVSASQKTNGTGPGGTDPLGPMTAFYSTASTNGNEVFFMSCEQLTNDSTAGPVGGNEESREECDSLGRREPKDLYRYEVSTGKLADLSVDPFAGQKAEVVGVLGASEDGSSVYFVAHGALVEGAPSGTEVFNVYFWHEGRTALVTTIHKGDFSIPGPGAILFGTEATLEGDNARVSPNGRYLAFESAAPLTGYDSEPASAASCSSTTINSDFSLDNRTGRCLEVYEYDAQSATLKCVSCRPGALPPVGNSFVPVVVHTLESLQGWQSGTDQQRYLLDDGRLFFDSADVLLPAASNGTVNVYQYEPAGVGSCAQQGGCVALISSGTSDENSFFLDASTSGNDVFFTTRQQLVAADGDEAIDLYDARVGGGLIPFSPPPCSGEACRPPVTPAPAIYQAPPSATFVGPGNPPQVAPQSTTSKAKKPKPKPRKAKRKRRRKTAHKARARRSSSRGSHR